MQEQKLEDLKELEKNTRNVLIDNQNQIKDFEKEAEILKEIEVLKHENKRLKKINKDFENKSYQLWIKNKNLENVAEENKTLKSQLQKLNQVLILIFLTKT